ncbi:hypothetical protein HYT55_03365 [Candidatus Woesearchaeota archaeon]|nr:hypothetical protein [Candidatus Woesearchaeota archaeon]
MNKKRDAFPILHAKKGQITIFIILGLVILTVFLFLIFIVNTSQRANLEAEKAEAFDSIYSKEGLYLYLDTCLKDSLTEAVALIQKQGRLWRDINPGGFVPFEEGKTGVTVNGVPIAYGLIYNPFELSPEAYPCASEEGKPTFCSYHYPDSTVRFGELVLSLSTVEDDLRRYLNQKVVDCAEKLAVEEIAPDAVVEISNPQFTVSLQSNGIAVDATIPFSMVIRGIHYFTTSSLKFFYDTPLREVVETAAYFPLQADRDHIDFSYDENTLIAQDYVVGSKEELKGSLGQSMCTFSEGSDSSYFMCTKKLVVGYSSLGLKMNFQNLDNGDTHYTFISPTVHYTFARQNRPPALDYVARYACPRGEYDYLAIAGDPALGTIDITVTARDPDEQLPTVSVIDISETPLSADSDPLTERFVASSLNPGQYLLKAAAKDPAGLEDTQEVRVVVDNPISTSISVHHMYPDLMTATSEEIVLVSPEDPITVEMNLPQKSLTEDLGEFRFSFLTDQLETLFDLIPDQGSPFAFNSYSFVFPYGFEGKDLIREITDTSQFKYAPFTSNVKQGTFTLNYNINYCGYHKQSSESSVPVIVTPCLPHQNSDHPFPYPYQDYVDKDHDGIADRDTDGELVLEKLEDPFDASHACCLGDPTVPAAWKIASLEDNVGCFRDMVDEEESLGCFGDVDAKGRGYLLEKRITRTTFCSGSRGNVCDGEEKFEAEPQQKCGIKSQTECSLVAQECQGLAPYTKGDGFWCSGDVGCGDTKSNACTSEIVTNVKGLSFDYVQSQHEQYSCGCTSKEKDRTCLRLSDEVIGTCRRGTIPGTSIINPLSSYACR